MKSCFSGSEAVRPVVHSAKASGGTRSLPEGAPPRDLRHTGRPVATGMSGGFETGPAVLHRIALAPMARAAAPASPGALSTLSRPAPGGGGDRRQGAAAGDPGQSRPGRIRSGAATRPHRRGGPGPYAVAACTRGPARGRRQVLPERAAPGDRSHAPVFRHCARSPARGNRPGKQGNEERWPRCLRAARAPGRCSGDVTAYRRSRAAGC
jgi:hypothetical protein